MATLETVDSLLQDIPTEGSPPTSTRASTMSKTSGEQQQFSKHVLITGGAGFIGSHATTYFVNKYPEYQFIVIDNLSYCANIKNLLTLFDHKNFKFIHGSITSQDLIRHLFDEYDINVIIHFAAETHVDHSFHHSFAFTQTNVLGTHILLECAKRRYIENPKNFELFLHISTDEVYGESKMDDQYKDAKKETDKMCPTNPYSASKAAAEIYVKTYHESFKLPVIITRSSNIYGPRQFPEKMIPKFIYLINQSKSVCIYGTGKNVRIYLHVSDLVSALDTVRLNGEIGEVYNITCDMEFDTIQVTNKLLECFDDIPKTQYTKYIQFVKDRPFHDTRYYLNGEKFKKLGWKPKISFENGLKSTVEWYLQNGNYWKNLQDVLIPHPTAHHDTNAVYGGDKKTEDDDDQ